jgi:IS1 family transposase
MLVRGVGIRDISEIEQVSIHKVLSVLVRSNHKIKPKQNHYDKLEVDEFWTYVGSKKNKVWLIYAYLRATGEIVTYIWGKRNLKIARKLRDKLVSTGIAFDTVCTDARDSFISVFKQDNYLTGTEDTKDIEGNHCRLRHRIRWAFRKTGCFSKKWFNHFKTFDWTFFYINLGFV